MPISRSPASSRTSTSVGARSSRLADGLARAIEALRLEPLRRGEQRHHHRGFFVFADQQRADDGDHHQGVDVERAAPDRTPGALGRKHRADHGGGDEQGLHPPRTAREPADRAARTARSGRNGGQPAASSGAGRLGRLPRRQCQRPGGHTSGSRSMAGWQRRSNRRSSRPPWRDAAPAPRATSLRRAATSA